MTELEKIQAQIKELQAKEEELKKAELKPFEWESNDPNDNVCYPWVTQKFYFHKEPQMQSFAKKLLLQSVILRLKQSLGDEWEFTVGEDNNLVFYNHHASEFEVGCTGGYERDLIYFDPNTENAQKVADWLNKNWDYEKGEVKK